MVVLVCVTIRSYMLLQLFIEIILFFMQIRQSKSMHIKEDEITYMIKK